MEKRISQVALAVVVIAGICWLGGINIRAMIGFDLLEPGTLDFKSNIHPYVERAVYSLIAQSSLVVNISYVIVWAAGIVLLRSSSYRMKDHGWLMMAAILFYLFTPVEIYAMVLDLKIWYLDKIGSNDLVEFRKIFIHRLAALAGVPMIALLSYYTAIVVTIFRPFGARRMPPNVSPN